MDVTKKTVIPKTRSEIFKGCPPPKTSVKINVSPVSPRKRPFEMAATAGRQAGKTVRYANPSEMGAVLARASIFALKLVHNSGPSPWFIHRVPNALTTSSGRGNTANGERHQITTKIESCKAIRICSVVFEITRLGRNASAIFLPRRACAAAFIAKRWSPALCRHDDSGHAPPAWHWKPPDW